MFTGLMIVARMGNETSAICLESGRGGNYRNLNSRGNGVCLRGYKERMRGFRGKCHKTFLGVDKFRMKKVS